MDYYLIKNIPIISLKMKMALPHFSEEEQFQR